MIRKYWQEFEERAKAFGHDPEVLFRGAEIINYHTIQTPDGFRRFISATPDQRIQRMERFFTPPLQQRQRLAQGVHDRVECYVFAGGTLREADLPKINTYFPTSFFALSVAEKRIGKNECWDVSAPPSDPPTKTYTFLNIGRLILEEGARIVVRGDVFLFLCQELIVHPVGKDQESFHIGILPGPALCSMQKESPHSIHGKPGLRGKDGKSGYWRRSLVGPVLVDEVHPSDLNGSDGEDGSDGLPGNSGTNGNMCYIAELAIRELHGELTVYTRAGDGEDGADGGNGGDGGDGGDGTDGCKYLGGIVPSGHGGKGGFGGNGGHGGHGGHGGISSNVYLLVPPEAEAQVRCKAFPSSSGKGGRGGIHGQGGKGGSGGHGNEYLAPGNKGMDGLDGICGKDGKDGRNRSAATVFINEKIVDASN